MTSSLEGQTLLSIQKALSQGLFSLTDLVNSYLAQIEATKGYNIYVEVFAKEALTRAAQLEHKPIHERGKLFGVVVSIKDVLCVKGYAVSAGSKILEGFTSLYTATAIQRLLDEDAIIIGRTNCDEFAMGSTNETSYYGPTHNGANDQLVPGGSSGGSAVSVQLDTCLIAIGSDTGGSVRQPAALCGVYGLKPTYGRISRHGLIAYASSFDQIGILAKDLHGIARCLEVMAGPDQYDATVSDFPVAPYSDQLHEKKVTRVGYFPASLKYPGLSENIRQTTQSALSALKEAGYEVKACECPLLDYLVPTYYILTTAEASSNLSRFDGVRFGHRSEKAITTEEVITFSRSEGFGQEVKRRILLGTFVLSAGYYDAYFDKALRVRRLLVEMMAQIFEEVDVLLLPTTTREAWPLGQSLNDPVEMYLSDIYTVLSNLTGTPGLNIPVTGSKKEQLPIGLQALGSKFQEGMLMSFGQQLAAILSKID